LVAVPTETVYGLAADASNASALDRLYEVKGRPRGHPVIVHVAGVEQLPRWSCDIPPEALKLAEAFWPGPLTLVLKRSESVLEAVTGGAATVALRVPAHPLSQALLSAFAAAASEAPAGLAMPSANRFGRVSPTTAQHVVDDLGASVDLVLDGGPCEVGIESTIVDLSGEEPALLRPGGVPRGQIEAILERPLADSSPEAPRVPGSLVSHYAPRARVQLATRREIIDAVATNRSRRIAVLGLEVSIARLPAGLAVVVPVIATQYARGLYANLRALDATGADIILVEKPPETPSWAGVLDRLRRAAGTT
jgi:L-threonylcarbamoyladenylate synthase